MTRESDGGVGAGNVFVSHSSKDAATVLAIVSDLEAAGVRCWLAPRDIGPGSDYAEAISGALATCSSLLLVFSGHTDASTHCLREVELALRHGLRIVPLRIDDAPVTGGYEYRLATVQWLDDIDQLTVALGGGRTTPERAAPALDPSRLRRRPPPPLAGRRHEAETITAALDSVERHRSGRFVLVHGDSGVGKSVIAEWAAYEASRRGWQMAATVCEPFHEGMSFFPVRELIRQLTTGSSPSQELTRLHGRVSVEVAMASLADADDVDPTARRDALLATFANVVIAATAPAPGALDGSAAPVLLLVDDLERVDAGTTDGLLCLLARLAEAPVLVVGTYRSDLVFARRTTHPLTPLLTAVRRAGDQVVDVAVGPIARSDVRLVIEAVLDGPSALPRSFLDRIWAETEGNPLYLREVLRTLQDVRTPGTSLVQRDGSWTLDGDITTWRTPASVEEAIRGRLELMDATSREELEKASVIGRRFAFAVMLHLTEYDEQGLIKRLEECITLSLIAEAGGDEEAFEFTHGKIRDVLYDSMSRIRRRRLHSTVADALTALQGTLAEDWEGLIGEHLFQAGRYAEATTMLRVAAERMLRVSAANDAAGLLEKAVYSLRRSEGTGESETTLRLTWVRALVAANQYDEGMTLAESIIADPEVDLTSRGWACDYLGDIHWTTGRWDQALESYAQAERIALETGDRELELEVCADLAELHDRASEQFAGVDDALADRSTEAAASYLARQLALAAGSPNVAARARALRNEAKQLRRQGEVVRAIARYEEALALTDRRVATHSVLISYAKTLRFDDRFHEAVDVVDRVMAWATQSGARRSLGIALHYRALLRFEADGPVPQVKEDLDDALLIHREIEYQRGEWEVLTLMGEWWAANGEWDEALACFESVLPDSEERDADALVAAVHEQLDAIGEASRASGLAERWERRSG